MYNVIISIIPKGNLIHSKSLKTGLIPFNFLVTKFYFKMDKDIMFKIKFR